MHSIKILPRKENERIYTSQAKDFAELRPKIDELVDKFNKLCEENPDLRNWDRGSWPLIYVNNYPIGTIDKEGKLIQLSATQSNSIVNKMNTYGEPKKTNPKKKSRKFYKEQYRKKQQEESRARKEAKKEEYKKKRKEEKAAAKAKARAKKDISTKEANKEN